MITGKQSETLEIDIPEVRVSIDFDFSKLDFVEDFVIKWPAVFDFSLKMPAFFRMK